jgi:hypothetical protein
MGLKVFHHLSMKVRSEDFMVTVAARRTQSFFVFGHFFFSLKKQKCFLLKRGFYVDRFRYRNAS